MRRLFSLLGNLLSLSVGRLSWSAPPWLSAIGSLIGRHPRASALAILLAVSAAAGYYAYRQLPIPLQYLATAEAPGLSQIVDDELQPQNLRIRFDVDPASRTAAAVAARRAPSMALT